MNTLSCALALQAQLDRQCDRIRQLEAENTQLREALTEKSRECEHWKSEAEKRGAVGWNQHD